MSFLQLWLTVKPYIGTGFAGLVAVLCLLEWGRIPINPWSWILERVGEKLNKAALDKVETLSKEIKDIKSELEDVKSGISEAEAKNARARILEMGDGLSRKQEFSKGTYQSIFVDISAYERYCDAHHEFENGMTPEAIKFIKECFANCLRDNSFLK